MNPSFSKTTTTTAVVASVLLLVWLAAVTPPTDAFMPEVCLVNATTSGGSGVCCPAPAGLTQACGGPGRGSCQVIYIQNDHNAQMGALFAQDDRYNWPSKFFTRLCKCEGNFFGVACDECWFGWSGPACNTHRTYVRKNVLKLTPRERDMFVNVVAQMPNVWMTGDLLLPFEADNFHSDPMTADMVWQKANLHYYISAVHRYASRSTLWKNARQCQEMGFLDNNHNVVGFLTWHRYLMLVWERELRKIATDMYGWDDFAIPYWDWIDANECEPCVNSLVGAPGPYSANGDRLLDPGSAFAQWVEYCTIPRQEPTRCYGCHASYPNFRPLVRNYTSNAFPTSADLDFTLSRRTYYLASGEEGLTKCRAYHQAAEGFCGRPDDTSTELFMHNRVHNMVNGSMCCSATASNDPLFILHHSQMDRIWQLWYRFYRPSMTEFPNHGVKMGNCRECNMVGFLPPVKHVQLFTDLFELGVDYDSFDFGRRGFSGANFLKNGPSHTEEYWADMYARLHPSTALPDQN